MKGQITCPVCKGQGTVTEDQVNYEFITRDPVTSRCLICHGTGVVGANKKLPNGTFARSVPQGPPPSKLNLRRRGIDPSEEPAAPLPDTGPFAHVRIRDSVRTSDGEIREVTALGSGRRFITGDLAFYTDGLADLSYGQNGLKAVEWLPQVPPPCVPASAVSAELILRGPAEDIIKQLQSIQAGGING
jgi:hypothetical protein